MNIKHSHLCYFIILAAVLFFSACSKRLIPSTNYEPIIYPAPPDTARIQFLTGFSTSIDITGKPNKFKTFVAGEEKPLPISKPYGLAIHKGKIFVADAGIAGLQVIDLENKTFDYFIPKGNGQLRLPINCFVDAGGDLYVTDVNRKQVIVFDEQLQYKGVIGGDENFKPADAVVLGDTIFVTDPKYHRINAYSKDTRELLYSFPDAQTSDEYFLYNPLNLCVKYGKIYVTDFGDSRVKVFTLNGEFIRSVGSYGRFYGQFLRIKGIAVDKEENLFAVDAGIENVQIFNMEGKLLLFFGGHYTSPGGMNLPANVVIDYDHLAYYEKFVDPAYQLKYLIFVTNQYGPDKVSVYGRIDPK